MKVSTKNIRKTRRERIRNDNDAKNEGRYNPKMKTEIKLRTS
jgi:hypothetical protein